MPNFETVGHELLCCRTYTLCDTCYQCLTHPYNQILLYAMFIFHIHKHLLLSKTWKFECFMPLYL